MNHTNTELTRAFTHKEDTNWISSCSRARIIGQKKDKMRSYDDYRFDDGKSE